MASPFLTKRRAGWYFRIRVPADLVHIFGSHLTRSLETRDHSVARQRAVATAARVLAHWEELRRTMVARWKGKEIGELMPADMVGADHKELDRFEAGLTHEDRARFRQRLSLLVHAEQKDLIEYQADIMEIGKYVSAMEVHRLKGAIEGLKAAVAVLAAASPREPAPVIALERPEALPEAPKPVGDPRALQPWDDFFPNFFKDRPSIGESARQSHKQAFRDLGVVIDKKAFGEVTKADIKRFADWLRDKEIDRAGRTRLSRETIIKILSHVRSYFGWAVESEIIKINPTEGVRARTETREERDGEGAREAFTREQLELIFHSPLFTGCESAARRTSPGNMLIRDERYWYFLALMMTGARVEELADAPAVFVRLDDIDCLDLDGTKTVNAPRIVPILPELRRLGFLEWAKTKTKESDGKLFQGGAAFGDWSKGANRYLRGIGILDPRLVAYSFRHNFRQMLNGAGLSVETSDKLFGHGKKGGRTVGANYGRKLSIEEARLFIDRVRSPVDLSHLYPISKLR